MVWILARLVYLPFWIIRSAAVEATPILLSYGKLQTTEPHRLLFTGLLSALLVMHVYWTKLIGIIIYNRLKHGVRDDCRED